MKSYGFLLAHGYTIMKGYLDAENEEEAIYDCNDEFVLSKFCPYCGAKMDKN